MQDYQNGRIYTIRCRTDNSLIYVGSTKMPYQNDSHSLNQIQVVVYIDWFNLMLIGVISTLNYMKNIPVIIKKY